MKILFTTLILLSLSLNTTVPYAQYLVAPSECEVSIENLYANKIKWRDNSDNEWGFYVERAQIINDSAYWETIGIVTSDEKKFYDYWITQNRTYYYRVCAFEKNSRSDYSNVDSITLTGDTLNLPATPSNLRVTKATLTSISIRWDDNSYNEDGFIIARRREDQILFEYIDSVGTDVLTYQEVGLTPDNVYYYKVCSYNEYGISDYSNTVSALTRENTKYKKSGTLVPNDPYLKNNFPNPFNPSTTIEFGITATSLVSLKIYNSLGREVTRLLNESLSPGSYSVTWNAASLPSGVYYYKIETDVFTEIKKMILIK